MNLNFEFITFLQELLSVIRQTENDDLTDALQDLIKQYQDDPRLGQMAVIIAQHLVCKNFCFFKCSTCPFCTRENAQVAKRLLQICLQDVDKLCSHCLFLVVVTGLEQAVNYIYTHT
jgi:hypothetical protein